MVIKIFKLGKRQLSERVVPDSNNASVKMMKLLLDVFKAENPILNTKHYKGITIPNDIPKPFYCFYDRKKKSNYVIYLDKS